MGERIIVSVHAQKPAGTSLALMLHRPFDQRPIYHCQDDSGPRETTRELRQGAGFSRNYRGLARRGVPPLHHEAHAARLG